MKDRKMSLHEYSLLSEIEQYQLVYKQGTILDFRLTPHSRFNLYALCMFYVEVEYNFDIKKIVGKKEFIYDEVIDKYVNGNK